MFKKIYLLLVFVLFFVSTAQAQTSDALVIADHVRVWSSLQDDKTLNGYLFKNMKVKIEGKSENTLTAAGITDYWYKVSLGDVEGWAFGGFLNFDVPAVIPDTYSASGNLNWFFKRFGYSTFYTPQRVNLGSFNMDEYRSLIKAVEQRSDVTARAVLEMSLYKGLENNTDPKWEYLRKKIYSLAFLKKMRIGARY